MGDITQTDAAVEEQDGNGTPGRVEAAIINHVADVIGNWADRKGFREDWSDADRLEEVAKIIDDLEAGPLLKGGRLALFGRADAKGVMDELEIGELLRLIAKEHRRLANMNKIALMMTELAEAVEGSRDGGNYGEELADLIIRALENAHKNRVPIGDEIVAKVAVNEQRSYKHGRQF